MKWQLYYDKLVDFQSTYGHVNIQQVIEEYEHEHAAAADDDDDDDDDVDAATTSTTTAATTTTTTSSTVNVTELQDLLTWYDEQVDGYKKLMLKQKTKLTKKRAYALQQINALPLLDEDLNE